MAQLGDLIVTGVARFLNRIHADITGDAGSVGGHETPTSGNASTTQVVLGNDTRLTDSRTPSSHTHGDIQNNGTISSTAVTPANGDYILISDANATNNHSVKRGIAIGTSTGTYLRNDGTWQTPPNNNTTYSFADGTNSFTVTPSGGTAQTVNVTPSFSDTGSMLNPVHFDNGSPVASSGNTIPFIVGTGSTAGTWLGELEGLTEYYDGLLILYKPSVAGASTTKLNINNIGAKTCYLRSNTKLTTHYPALQPILLVYSTSLNSGCWMAVDDYNSDSDTYDRTRYNAAIMCGSTAIVAKNIIVADSNGLYKHLKLGTTFDITYPILYANADISANTTGTNNYLILNIAIATTQSITLTAYQPVYIKGTLYGTTFTPVSTTPLTQTLPDNGDNYQYMLLGVATSTTALYLKEDHIIYTYNDGYWGKIAHYSEYASYSYSCLNAGYATNAGSADSATYDSSNNNISTYIKNVSTSSVTNATSFTFTRGNGSTFSVAAANNDTKNTAGSTDTSSKIFLIGATSQAANPQTYSDNEVYATSGVLSTKSVQVGNTAATMQYNSTLEAIEFVFS